MGASFLSFFPRLSPIHNRRTADRLVTGSSCSRGPGEPFPMLVIRRLKLDLRLTREWIGPKESRS